MTVYLNNTLIVVILGVALCLTERFGLRCIPFKSGGGPRYTNAIFFACTSEGSYLCDTV